MYNDGMDYWDHDIGEVLTPLKSLSEAAYLRGRSDFLDAVVELIQSLRTPDASSIPVTRPGSLNHRLTEFIQVIQVKRQTALS